MSEEPTKAKDIPARERFASTTFRALPHAQTPEGMLEAKDAEIAALRAECARKDAALIRALPYVAHSTVSWRTGADRVEVMFDDPEGTRKLAEEIEAALTPSDAGKKWAAMARVCEDAEEALESRPDTVVYDVGFRRLHDSLAALRAMEGA